MKRFVRVLFLIVALSMVALSFGCPTPTPTPTATTGQTTAASPTTPFQPMKLVFATTQLPGSGTDLEIDWITKRIPEATGGRIKLVSYPYASLFTNTETASALMAGGTDFTIIGYTYMSWIMPVLNAIGGTMRFENQAHLNALWQSGIAAEINLKLEKERGIKIVTTFRPGSCPTTGKTPIYNSVRPITKLEDMKGMKIRLPPSKSLSDAFVKLGVSVISIPVADAPLALQQRMIDGLLTSWKFVSVYSLNTLVPYCLDEEIDMSGSGENFGACLKTWNKLPPDIQTAIYNVVAKEMYEALDINTIMCDPDAKGKATYQNDPKTKTNTLSAAERARWVDIIRPAWQETVDSLPASDRDLGQRLLNIIEELRPQFVKK